MADNRVSIIITARDMASDALRLLGDSLGCLSTSGASLSATIPLGIAIYGLVSTDGEETYYNITNGVYTPADISKGIRTALNNHGSLLSDILAAVPTVVPYGQNAEFCY